MKLLAFFEEIYSPRRLTGKSDNTRRLYRLSIGELRKTLGREPKLSDLTDDNLCRLIERRLGEGKAAPTVNKDLSQLLALWRFAHKRGDLRRWPDTDKLDEPEQTPWAWMPEDIAKLERQLAKMDGTISGVPEGLWWRTLFHACLDTAERIGALRDCHWSWLENDWLHIPASARKRKTRDRMYRLRPSTVAMLQEMREASPKCKFIWPWPWYTGSLWPKFGKILEAAGLPNNRKSKFHRARRTSASMGYAAGLDPQEILDHQYRRTSMKYLDPRYSRKQQVSDVLSRYLENPAPTPNQNPKRDAG